MGQNGQKLQTLGVLQITAKVQGQKSCLLQKGPLIAKNNFFLKLWV